MGKKGKKRKMELSDLSNHSENCNHDTEGNTVSVILGDANNVLYGNTDLPTVSTPIAGQLDTSGMNSRLNEMNQKLDFIMNKLTKLDVIEKRMDRLDGRLDSVETRMDAAEKKTVEFEQSVNFVSNKCDEFQSKSDEISEMSRVLTKQKQEMTSLMEGIERQKTEIEKLSAEMGEMSAKKEELTNKVTDLQCRSMKYNLVFTGLCGETRDEDTTDKVRNFIYNELGIEHRIEFCNVHRFGRFVHGKERPIVAKFLYNADRELVKENAYLLRGSGYGIHEQFPKVIEDRRRELYPIMKDMKRIHGGKNVKLIRDKLYVNGRPYDVNVHGYRAQEHSDPEPNRQPRRDPQTSGNQERSAPRPRQEPVPMDNEPAH
ncbi:hypothetical protein FSP39_021547 [Pinctada imbricata]|uniref:Uncharacterized protein n=1 Tax=Pinctada imbricata TaxID=66713 RepID=A0AA88XL58_PINIB|nr:hypothetical protein FSP39_021547 [Pinctada imbricata]